MTVTLTANYKDTLKPETVAVLEELCGEDGEGGSYCLEDALIFIDEYSESDFVEYYEEYIELGEQYTFPAVEAYVSQYGWEELSVFTDSYVGEFSTPVEMAQDYLTEESDETDERLCIDWEATAEYLIDHEVDRVGNFYFTPPAWY